MFRRHIEIEIDNCMQKKSHKVGKHENFPYIYTVYSCVQKFVRFQTVSVHIFHAVVNLFDLQLNVHMIHEHVIE